MSFIKQATNELHQQTKDIKSQLVDQIKAIEQRTDTQVAILHDVNDFLKKRAELDLEYSKQLEKLTKSTMLKHKNERQKRANWPLFSTCGLWQQLVDDTKDEARQRLTTAEVYLHNVCPSITARCSMLQKISKKCREIGVQAQSEIIRVLSELQSAMKAYQLCFNDYMTVKEKLGKAELSKQKCEDANSLRKQKSVQKNFDKCLTKYEAVKLKCNRARNEYLLCIDATNAAMHKYYAEDLADLIDCTDLGLEFWLNLILTNVIAARKAVCQQEMTALASLSLFRESMHLPSDKQKYFETNSSVFMLPKSFVFKHDPGEGETNVVVAGCLTDDLSVRKVQVERRLETLRSESNSILDDLNRKDEEMQMLLSTNTIVQINSNGLIDTRAPLEASEAAVENVSLGYLEGFRHHLLNGNLIERLQARANSIGRSLTNDPLQKISSPRIQAAISAASTNQPQGEQEWHYRLRRKKRVVSMIENSYNENFGAKRPKLFGGSLEEYVEATGENIPLVVTSCIRILSHYALHHQGVFRISGSQVEINNMKEAFENGDDPLGNLVNSSDVNSIAGLLKLYLRELREPLFPMYLFEQLTDCAKCKTTQDFINQITPFVNKLPTPTFLLLRYLFAFLNHLSQFSDENMMDPFNLAICFGPTLLPIPDDKDQVYYQTSVNEVIKNCIEYHDSIFLPSFPGPAYEAYDDGINFTDDNDDCFATGTTNSDFHSIHNESSHSGMLLAMNRSYHTEQDGVPGMDRQLARAAAAVVNQRQRRSLYSVPANDHDSSPVATTPINRAAVYDDSDDRFIYSHMRTLGALSSPTGPPSMITPLSTNSSTAHTSISGESTESTGVAQKENGSPHKVPGSPKKCQDVGKRAEALPSGSFGLNILQERSSIDSGFGVSSAASKNQNPSPTHSASTGILSKLSECQGMEKSRSANKIRSIPLSAQMTYQQDTSRLANGGKSTPDSSTSSSSSPRMPSALSAGAIYRRNPDSQASFQQEENIL